jgi:PAS domain S-box-containing protein
MDYADEIGYFGYACFISFIPFFLVSILEYIKSNKNQKSQNRYIKKLNSVLVNQVHNKLFYEGEVNEGAKVLTKEVSISIESDRCSIWLYNEDKTSISCQQLYVASEDKWYQGIELKKEDFEPYFVSLSVDPIIVANDAEAHQATSCFKESYLSVLGIKSMLDVPVLYRGELIGVVCIESLKKREWKESEIRFAQILSSLYSFSYSIKVMNQISDSIKNIEDFVDHSVLVSKADKTGKIIYVNHKFEEVSGYTSEEVVGKDHNILNSGIHPKKYWKDMYKKVVTEREIWNDVVINKNKKGDLYWVDSYIKGEFDNSGNLLGFMSIRYDVTELIKASKEIEKKNTYLEHAAKILRHDMHSGINTYIPRGISSLERRLTSEDIENLKIEAPLKMIKEGLKHSQKVYRGVYEFTNLVKKDAVMEKSKFNLREILENYLVSTAYRSQVLIEDLPEAEVNESLFCTALDNLIRNGLKYNDSESKWVKVYKEGKNIILQDNGRGMSQKEFEKLSQPYTRKEGQKESGSGLGLNICIAILQEHGFTLTCEKNEIGTKMKIKIK